MDAAKAANVRSGRKRIAAGATAASLVPTVASTVKKPAGSKSNPNPRSGRKRTSANSKTNRNYDAAPGGTNRNPRARSQSITRDVTGGVKTKAGTYKTFKKKSEAAKSFRSAFANARKSGYKTFTWNGKKYNTKTK